MRQLTLVVFFLLMMFGAAATAVEPPAPSLSVMTASHGSWIFEGAGNDPVILTVEAPATIYFAWVGEADAYGGTIAGYRTSPDSTYNPDYKSATLEYFFGAYTFFIEVIDNAGTVSRADFRINVVQELPVKQSTWGAIKALYTD